MGWGWRQGREWARRRGKERGEGWRGEGGRKGGRDGGREEDETEEGVDRVMEEEKEGEKEDGGERKSPLKNGFDEIRSFLDFSK